jgi:CRISPR-associated protein Cas2
MYVILVYDISEKRVGKACKLCRRYLNWVQNSVFEGEITDAKLARLRHAFGELMEGKEDSVLIYKLRTESAVDREVMGIEKLPTDNLF